MLLNNSAPLREDLANYAGVLHLQSFAAGDFEAAGVEAKLVQHGGVDVGDVVTVFDGLEAKLIGRAGR